MRMIAGALCLCLVAAEAIALESYNPTKMQCADVKAVIRQHGAVMLRWTSPISGVPRYGRYVANSGYCGFGERARNELVPSGDKKSCGVNVCRPYIPGEDGFF